MLWNAILAQIPLEFRRIPVVTLQSLPQIRAKEPQEGGQDEGRDGFAGRKAHVNGDGFNGEGVLEHADNETRAFAIEFGVCVELVDIYVRVCGWVDGGLVSSRVTTYRGIQEKDKAVLWECVR